MNEKVQIVKKEDTQWVNLKPKAFTSKDKVPNHDSGADAIKKGLDIIVESVEEDSEVYNTFELKDDSLSDNQNSKDISNNETNKEATVGD